MTGIIIELKEFDIWKIQLTIAVNFISSRDAEEERVMHLNSDNIKFMPCNDANEVVVELFEPLISRYQGNLGKSMRESDFVFDSVQFFQWFQMGTKKIGIILQY